MTSHSVRVSTDIPSPSSELLAALGTTLQPDLLVEALTHRSFSHEHPEHEHKVADMRFAGLAALKEQLEAEEQGDA